MSGSAKACPFCGRFELIVEFISSPPKDEYFVECDYCGATGPIAFDDASALEEWDERK